MDSIISGLYGLMNHAPELPKSWKQADEQDSWRDKAKDVIRILEKNTISTGVWVPRW